MKTTAVAATLLLALGVLYWVLVTDRLLESDAILSVNRGDVHLHDNCNTHTRRVLNGTVNLDRPVVLVGGFGGSGTRSVVESLLQFDLCMKQRYGTNPAHDNMLFQGFKVQKHSFRKYTGNGLIVDVDAFEPADRLAVCNSIAHLSLDTFESLDDACRNRDVPWGFKSVKNSLYVPMYHKMFGDALRFIHIVRDVRNLLCPHLRHYSYVTRILEFYNHTNNTNTLMSTLQAWNHLNFDLPRWATATIPNNFLVVRYEDLNSPDDRTRARTLEQMYRFVFDKVASPSQVQRQVMRIRDHIREILPVNGTDDLIKYRFQHARACRINKVLRPVAYVSRKARKEAELAMELHRYV